MEQSNVRVLIVDDFLEWRSYVRSALLKQPALEIVGEVSDGLEAVQKAEELRPDLILLDIGIPRLNGIEVSRKILQTNSKSKILFISGDRSPEIVEAALQTGASGYVVKSDAGRELLPAVEAVLQGQRFVGKRFDGFDLGGTSGSQTNAVISRRDRTTDSVSPVRRNGHVVQFYKQDPELLNSLGILFRDALAQGQSVGAVLTESHRVNLCQQLSAQGVDVEAATKTGRLLMLDALETLNKLMDGDCLNQERFFQQAEEFVRRIKGAFSRDNCQIVAFGEMVAVLWEKGNYRAALELEGLWNEVARSHSLYLCCAYPVRLFQEKGQAQSDICAEHDAVVPLF